MALINSIDPTTFIPTKGYSMKEEDSLPSVLVTPNFNPPHGRVESMIYDLSGNQYRYDPNAEYAASIPGAKEGENFVEAVTVDPEKVLTSIGLEQGSYNVVFNFLNNELQSSYERPFRIKEISANRKELRLTTAWLEREELQQAVEQFFPEDIETNYYPDFALNFGNGNICIANNILFDDTNNQYSVLVKLYQPLPSFIQEDSGLNPWIVTKQRDSVGYNVEFESVVLPVKTTIDIKGPNFSLDLNNQVHTTVKPTSLDDLESSDTTTEFQLQNILGRKGVNINIDYSNLDNFIHFSSAERRVRNFYDKVGLIEDLEAELAIQDNASDTTNDDVNIKGYQVTKTKIETIIKNFDGFEYWMYYTSASQEESGGGNGTTYNVSKRATSQTNTNVTAVTNLLNGNSGDAIFGLGTGELDLSGFGFSVNATASIVGIEVKYTVESEAPDGEDASFQATLSGSSFGSAVVGTTTLNEDDGAVAVTLGGPTNTLGFSNKKGSDIGDIHLKFNKTGAPNNSSTMNGSTTDFIPSIKFYYQSPLLKFPTPYPKSNSITPYTLVSTGSDDALLWLDSATTTASYFDLENQDNLYNTIPEYIRDDSDNDPYIKFVELVSQHFDVLFTYAQDITNRYNADNRLDFGISRDLVAEAIKSMGVNLYAGNFTAKDLAASFTSYNGYIPPQEDGSTIVNNYVTASVAGDDLPPIEDVNKEIYKRIYHNLPLLLRQKGSIAGLRTLVNVFGIPNEILNVKEFNIDYTFTTQSLPDANSDGQIEFVTQSAPSLPPEGSDSPPSEFLSPTTRVQQHFLTSASTYDRSLQYIEAGFSPQNYLDREETPDNDLGSNFYTFDDFYFGDNPTNYGDETGTGRWSTGAFMRYIKFFDTSLFNMIKDFTPARSSVATGFIWKPRINDTRNRYRPAQLSYTNNSYSGSGVTIVNAWSEFKQEGNTYESGSITRPIGLIGEKYYFRGTPNFGTASFPGGTGGTFDNSNLPRFNPDETKWDERKNLQTAISGLNQKWTEEYYKNDGSSGSFEVIRNDQSEFYNGSFRQSGLNNLGSPGGIGYGDTDTGYFEKEKTLGKTGYVIGQGSGYLKYNNNATNLYKLPVADSEKIEGLTKANVSTVSGFENSTVDIIYYKVPQFGDSFTLIYIKTENVAQNLLLSNGNTLVLKNQGGLPGGSVLFEIPVSNGFLQTRNDGTTFVGFFCVGFTGAQEQLFFNITNGSLCTYFPSSVNPDDFVVEQPWEYSDFNPLTGNSFDPASGQDAYAGIRKGFRFQDADYSLGGDDPYTPINLELLASGSASRAAIPDSNFTSDWWNKSRYIGVRNSSPDFNQKIIKTSFSTATLFNSASLGYNPEYSASQPQLPQVEPEGGSGK